MQGILTFSHLLRMIIMLFLGNLVLSIIYFDNMTPVHGLGCQSVIPYENQYTREQFLKNGLHIFKEFSFFSF